MAIAMTGAGLFLVVAGLAWAYPPLGVVTAGVILVLAGLFLVNEENR